MTGNAVVHFAYWQNLATHPDLRYLAPHIDAMAADSPRLQPGVDYLSEARDVLYVKSGIGKMAVDGRVFDAFHGVVQIDGRGVPFQVLPPLQDIDVRRITMRR